MAHGSVRKRGNRWYAIYPITDPVTGKRKQKEEVAGDTKREADRLLRERMNAIDGGRYVEPSKLTVAAYLEDQWLPAVKATLKPSTHYAYRQTIRLHVVPHIGSVRVQQLTSPALNALYADLLEHGRYKRSGAHRGPGLHPGTVLRVHRVLRKAFADGVKWHTLEHNPAEAADPPRGDGGHAMRTWTGEQLAAFLDACEQAKDRAAGRYLYAWLVAATTGMRRGELLGLTWDAVDLDNARARIERTVTTVDHQIVVGTPKTKKSRRSIELGPETVAVLRRWRTIRAGELADHGGWLAGADDVFCQPDGRPLNPDVFSRAFDRMVTSLDLPRIRFHDLRHTYATLGLEAGEHPRVMADRLGHANTSVTNDIYSHVTPRMDRELAERQERRIFRKDGT